MTMRKGILLAGLLSGLMTLTACGEKTALIENDNTLSFGKAQQVVENTEVVYEDYINYDYIGYHDLDYEFNEEWLQQKPGIDYGKVEIIQYYSKVAGLNRTAYVMLPGGYNPNETYPVVYLCHGINCGPSSYMDIGAMNMLGNLIDKGMAVPMIMIGTDNVVLTAEEKASMNSSNTRNSYNRALEDITESLMPYINSHYSVKTDKANTAISGFSMGGRTALYLGFARQDLFGYVYAVAPARNVVPGNTGGSTTPLLSGFNIDKKYGGFKLLAIVAGVDDTLCGPSTEKYDELLNEAGIKHMYYRVKGAHENAVWQSEFYNMAKRIFK